MHDVALACEATVGPAVAAARRRIAAAGAQTPALDARVLACRAFSLTTTRLIAEPERTVGATELRRFECMVERRIAGEPVSRIIGEREFRGLAFALTPDVLDPRPDTECVVETALRHARRLMQAGERIRLLDAGTGSGAILVSLLAELPTAFGVGTDRSHAAILIARQNARANRVANRTMFVAGDWLDAIGCRFHLIVANPPYVATPEIADLAREVAAFDPRSALDGGPDGLDAYRRIVPAAARLLVPGGALVVEVGAGQADAVAEMMQREMRGSCGEVERVRDLAGITRCVTATVSEV